MNPIYFQTPWDFTLIDSGDGYRLEKWGSFILKRPDPQAIWTPRDPKKWIKLDAEYKDRNWKIYNPKLKKSWKISFKNTKLVCKLTPFKHTGVFAEQAANWDWMIKEATNQKGKLNILNLFGYTGAASVILASAGHHVTHVDASKPAIAWAKENQYANNLPADSIRWILDDCVKFVKREIKRGKKYDCIIMDPPAFGHSPTGATWKFAEDLPKLVKDCLEILSPQAKFMVINAYATNTSSIALYNLLEGSLPNKSKLVTAELCLKEAAGRMVSTGIVARAIF